MYFRKKQSGGRVYLQIVESRRIGEQVRHYWHKPAVPCGQDHMGSATFDRGWSHLRPNIASALGNGVVSWPRRQPFLDQKNPAATGILVCGGAKSRNMDNP